MTQAWRWDDGRYGHAHLCMASYVLFLTSAHH